MLLRDLAVASNSSLSRLSHCVSRLERRGLLRRRADRADGRSTAAVLTEDGWDLVRRVAPAHAAEVRRLVFDHLDTEQVAQLRSIAQILHQRLQVGG